MVAVAVVAAAVVGFPSDEGQKTTAVPPRSPTSVAWVLTPFTHPRRIGDLYNTWLDGKREGFCGRKEVMLLWFMC